MATIEWGKGTDAELNIVTSVFGKGKENVVGWLNKGYATYINKEKALRYLRIPAPIAGAQDNQELSSATKIVKQFENPSVEDGNLHSKTSDYGHPDSDNNSHEQQKLSSEAEKLASSLNTPIRIVRDISEITDENERRQSRKRNSKGWYDTETVAPVTKSNIFSIISLFYATVRLDGSCSYQS